MKVRRIKRATLWALFVVSLALSQHAQSTDAAPAKAPLTEAERTQCRAQLTEFNQRVQSYNAELDALEAFESEIDTLRAALEKEEAAVDRHDSAALQALNAKIGKNNEMVERHDQMRSSLKAKSDENKRLAAQFREACENRTVAPSSSLKAPPPSLKAQPSDLACGSSAGAKDVQRRIEATFVEMRADEKKRQAEVERVADARAKEQSWSKEKRGKVWLQILSSSKFMAFEREKQPYVQELMRVIGSNPKNGQEECQLTQRIAAMLPAIKAINARQYAFMAEEIRAAK